MKVTFDVLDPDYNYLTPSAEARRKKVFSVMQQALRSGESVTLSQLVNAQGVHLERIAIEGTATHG